MQFERVGMEGCRLVGEGLVSYFDIILQLWINGCYKGLDGYGELLSELSLFAVMTFELFW